MVLGVLHSEENLVKNIVVQQVLQHWHSILNGQGDLNGSAWERGKEGVQSC